MHIRPAKIRRALPVQALLEWAFRRECAQLELPDRRDPGDRGYGFGMEYVLLERAKLGVDVDSSPKSAAHDTHEDADTVAAIVAGMPAELGGVGMAVRVAELARAGLTPDWMPGAVPRWQPDDWRYGPNGEAEGRAQIIRHEPVRVHDGKRWRRREHAVRMTPIHCSPSWDEIEAARRDYAQWWVALHDIAERLRLCGMLRQHEVAPGMPPAQPWATHPQRDRRWIALGVDMLGGRKSPFRC